MKQNKFEFIYQYNSLSKMWNCYVNGPSQLLLISGKGYIRNPINKCKVGDTWEAKAVSSSRIDPRTLQTIIYTLTNWVNSEG